MTVECPHERLFTTSRVQVCRTCGLARDLPDGDWRPQRQRHWAAHEIQVIRGKTPIDVCPTDGSKMDHTFDDRRRCPLCGLVWRRPTPTDRRL